MSCVLSIDLSCTPCELTISQIEGDKVQVVASTMCELPFPQAPAGLAALLASDELLTTLVELRSRKKAVNDSSVATSTLTTDVESAVQVLRESIANMEPIWTSCLVVVPQDNFLSLNLDLPFRDAKRLEPIVDLEVQDIVPFELDDFFIQYSIPSDGTSHEQGNSQGHPTSDSTQTTSASAAHDIHIGMLPRNTIGATLEICKQAGVEPSVITVPSSAIGAIYQIHPKLAELNSAVIYNRGDHYAIAVCISGKVRLEKSIVASNSIVKLTGEDKESALTQILTTIRIMIAAAEKKYGAKIEKVYLLGREVKGAQGEKVFKRPMEGLSLTEFLGSQASGSTVAPLAAIYAHEDATTNPLSNFRSRQFSFTPKLSEFFRALLGVKKVALRVALALGIALISIYATRQYYISSIASSLTSQIRRIIPDFEADQSSIAPALNKRRQLLLDELASFGTYSTARPVTYLTKILQAVPKQKSVVLSGLLIKSGIIRIDGTAPALSSIEEFTQALSVHTELFKKLDYKSQKSSRGGFSFSIDIQLPE